MRSFRFAWLSIVRQPGRAGLAILGVAAVGALLFDMLLLSRGLVLSFRELLDRAGFDLRVMATDAPPFTGPVIDASAGVVKTLSALPEIEVVLQLVVREAEIVSTALTYDSAAGSATRLADDGGTRAESGGSRRVEFIGADPEVRSLWRIVEGEDLGEDSRIRTPLVVNRNLADTLRLSPGTALPLRGLCGPGSEALPPLTFRVAGIADFPFDSPRAGTVAGTLADIARLCGEDPADRAEMLLVRSIPGVGADRAAAAIRAVRPDFYVVTNEELVEQFSRVEFSYFRQISVVLATVTLFFGFLLIAVLLTVSVNQRLGEIAALRALGLSRGRVVGGVLWESVMLVGGGGVLGLPLGAALSIWLDSILRAMPGLPADLHFFVFEPRALGLYAVLLAVASIAAAAYPMRVVASLPIAATLRREVVS